MDPGGEDAEARVPRRPMSWPAPHLAKDAARFRFASDLGESRAVVPPDEKTAKQI